MNQFASREVADLLISDFLTNKPFLFMDYALTTANSHSAESAYARGGRNNPVRVRFDGERASTLTVTTQLITFKLIAMLAGTEVEKGAVNIAKREKLIATEDSITLSKEPVAGSVTVFPVDKDCEADAAVEITVTGSTVTLTDGEDGKEYVAYYLFKSDENAESITFDTTKFPKYCKITGDTVVKEEVTGELVPLQMEVYKAMPNPTFTVNFSNSGDPTTFEITFDLFPNENNKTITYKKYK